METINDRIEMLINEHFNDNKTAFAEAMGMPPTSMSNYFGVKRRSKPSIDMVAKIVKTLDVDARWLLTGEETVVGNVSTKGDYSPASVHGNAINNLGETDVLKEQWSNMVLIQRRRINILKTSSDKSNTRTSGASINNHVIKALVTY